GRSAARNDRCKADQRSGRDNCEKSVHLSISRSIRRVEVGSGREMGVLVAIRNVRQSGMMPQDEVV
ncbi:hypothetical protein ACC690_38685, partial [Rhizobium johnstonii]|uniref:hypothetical protein n=1 Tax=Rhizobium johnstonii TaxID=3019933 RepID=UPI003F9C09CE